MRKYKIVLTNGNTTFKCFIHDNDTVELLGYEDNKSLDWWEQCLHEIRAGISLISNKNLNKIEIEKL